MKELTPQTISDHLRQIAMNDSSASFEIIYNHYYNRLFRQALFYFDDSDIAQEIISDLFIALWQSRKVLDKIEDPDAYLFISLKYARAKYIEKMYKDKKEIFTDNLPEASSEGSNPEVTLLDSELEERYQTAVGKLPPRCAEVFRLVREEKKKYSEAAEILGISVKTVENQMNKAVKILYNELKEHLFSVFF